MSLLKPGTRLCRCGACGRYFSGPTTFDMHRAGAAQERRCLDPSKQHDKRGIARFRQDGRGVWFSTRVFR